MSDSTFKSMSAPQYLVPIYNDLRTTFLSTTASGSNPPTYTRFAYNSSANSQGVFLNNFPGGTNVERELYLTLQLPHDYQEGSTIYPHLHFTIDNSSPSATGTTQWGFEYTYAPYGGSFPTPSSSATTIIYATYALNGTTNAYQHMILQFPGISISTLNISSVFISRIFRCASNNATNPDTYSGGIYAIEIDAHVQSNTAGSRQQFVK